MPTCAGSKQNNVRGLGYDRPLAKGNSSVASTRMAAASDLMAAGGQLGMPRLDGVPLQFQFSAGDRASIALARTLLELDLASPDDWEVANHDPAAYVLASLDRLIAAHGGDSLKRRFDLCAALTSCLDECSERNETNPDGSRLYLTVDPERCGFLILNPTVKLLEEANPRLPATFYGLFAGALNKWIRVYDYHEAEERVSMWREWMEGEPDAEQYEIPDVEQCIPACMRQRPLSRQKLRAVTCKVEGREVRDLLKAVLELVDISDRAARPGLTDEMREELCDTNPPLPSLLAVFAESDAIEACYDDEGQTALEVMPEPSVIIPLNAHEPRSVRQAFHSFGVVCDTLAAASRIIDRMPGNERWVIQG
jgi:hypothetical protein